jgi:hypothetical protein
MKSDVTALHIAAKGGDAEEVLKLIEGSAEK